MTTQLTQEDRQLLKLLLTPSWLSGLVAVVAGLAVSVVVIATFLMHNSFVNQQLVALQLAEPVPAYSPAGEAETISSQPTLQNSWPLIIFWGLVGLLVYALLATVIHAIVRAEGFREALKYVNANPRTMWASTIEHLLLRAVAICLLIGFGVVFWQHILPYAITAAYASAADPISLSGVLYAMLSFGVIAASAHIMTILVRLAAGRARVFSMPNTG